MKDWTIAKIGEGYRFSGRGYDFKIKRYGSEQISEHLLIKIKDVATPPIILPTTSRTTSTVALQTRDLVGNWDVIWSTGSKSSYSIKQSDSTVRIRITSCNWKASCAVNKEGELRPSTSVEYSYTDGWTQVENIHDGVLKIYLRMENNK